jgi:hypothetical protein
MYSELCAQATGGSLNIDDVKQISPRANSYLLDCALTPLITEDSLMSSKTSSSQDLDARKIELADFFWSRELDFSFQNDNGSNLLFSVVRSFLPLEWRVNAAKTLVSKGVNPKAENDFGKTPIDLAKTAEEKELFLSLSR